MMMRPSLKTVAIAAIAALQVADIISTRAALAVPGVIEINPAMALAQAHLGAAWGLAKVPFTAAAIAILWRKPSARPALIVAAIWAAVVANNLAWASGGLS